jgi:hypothetical protein
MEDEEEGDEAATFGGGWWCDPTTYRSTTTAVESTAPRGGFADPASATRCDATERPRPPPRNGGDDGDSDVVLAVETAARFVAAAAAVVATTLVRRNIFFDLQRSAFSDLTGNESERKELSRSDPFGRIGLPGLIDGRIDRRRQASPWIGPLASI